MIKLIFFDVFRLKVLLILLGLSIESISKNVVSILMGLLIECIYEQNQR